MPNDQDTNQLFRKEALDELSSTDQLDQMISITSPRSWLILLTLALLLVGLVAWGIFGRIPTRVNGRGILLAENGSIFSAVAPEGGGRLTKIQVEVGQSVAVGQTLADLYNQDLQNQVNVTKIHLQHLQDKFQHLSTQSKEAIKQRQQRIAQQTKVLETIIENEKRNLHHTKELLRIKQDAQKKGLDTRQEVVRTIRDYYITLRELENAQERLIQNQINVSNYIDQWEERLRDLDLKIRDEQYKLSTQQYKLELSKHVISPVAGTVTSIQNNIGDFVTSGEPVVTLANEGEGLDALIYILPKDGKRVLPGMKVLISPDNVEKEEYGSLEGKVLTVSKYPVTTESLTALLHNETLVKQFMEEGAPIAVRVRILRNANNYSGYEWSSSQGPDIKITPGTVATARITVRKQRPVSLVVPTLKKIIGVAD